MTNIIFVRMTTPSSTLRIRKRGQLEMPLLRSTPLPPQPPSPPKKKKNEPDFVLISSSGEPSSSKSHVSLKFSTFVPHMFACQ
jgi:hypothetical protein